SLLQIRVESGRGPGHPRGVLRAGICQGPRCTNAFDRHLVRRLRETTTMELLGNLWIGAQTAFTLWNLFYCLIGCFLGTAIGVLPGLGPTATIAMLLPITFGLPPVSALIMLSGIYYGAQYGGSTTAILVSLPGESSSVVTALDGYQLAKQGHAGRALGIAAI